MLDNLFSLILDAEMVVGNILEINLSPYSCRMHNGEFVVLGKKNHFSIAALQKQKDLSLAFSNKMQKIFRRNSNSVAT